MMTFCVLRTDETERAAWNTQHEEYAMNPFRTSNQDSLVAEIDRLAEAIVQRRQGKISEEDFRSLRLHHGIYGVRGLTDV